MFRDTMTNIDIDAHRTAKKGCFDTQDCSY